MNRARRATVTVLCAPFTRRARRDVRFRVVGTVIGLPLAVAALGLARGFGALHRLLLRAAGYAMAKLPVAVAEGYAAATTVIGLADCTYPLVWPLKLIHPAGTRLLPLNAVLPVPDGHWAIWNWPGTLSAVLAGAGSVLAGVWLARGITTVDARLMRSLLGPSRVSELGRTRAIAVEDAAAALRRVERDLHDGAQVRLAAVALNLGMAQERASDDGLRELLDAAQTGVSGALADLRRIARGIHPPVLDSGLAEALASLAAASPIPAQVRVDLPERLSQAIETIAYFCVVELLANAIKHSSANKIEITIDTERRSVLRLRVTDDGTGGADPSRGSGLGGLAQRASTVDGALRVSSPHGGPTTVTVELPMRVHGGVGYLLKDRVGNVADFISALERVAAGGTALDPEVISQLLRKPDPGLASLTPREREVLGLMAEGRSNSGIAAKLTLSAGAVEKHIASIFGKLSLEPEAADNRRVLAVLRYLRA